MKKKNNKSIDDRQVKDKKKLLEHLKKTPIVLVACDRATIGHTTYYRWRKEDEQFRVDADEALSQGESFISDLSESQLIALIKERNFPAIHLWLRTHHPKYGNKIEVMARIKDENTALTPEQERLVEEALGITEEQDHE
jgi:hypothetical protein